MLKKILVFFLLYGFQSNTLLSMGLCEIEELLEMNLPVEEAIDPTSIILSPEEQELVRNVYEWLGFCIRRKHTTTPCPFINDLAKSEFEELSKRAETNTNLNAAKIIILQKLEEFAQYLKELEKKNGNLKGQTIIHKPLEIGNVILIEQVCLNWDEYLIQCERPYTPPYLIGNSFWNTKCS